jgi:hypothetical protein
MIDCSNLFYLNLHSHPIKFLDDTNLEYNSCYYTLRKDTILHKDLNKYVEVKNYSLISLQYKLS